MKRENSEVEEAYMNQKKKLKQLEEEAKSCVKESDKKAKEALKKCDFKLLALSVALKEKGDSIRKNDVTAQAKVVQELQSKLIQ